METRVKSGVKSFMVAFPAKKDFGRCKDRMFKMEDIV